MTPPRNNAARPKKRPVVAKSMAPVEVLFGVVLLVVGTFVLIAVSNPLEIAVYAGGPILAVMALAFAITAIIRRNGAAPATFGLVGFALGALLGIHDFLFPPGIATFVHLGIAIAILVLGILQLASKKRFVASWFGPGKAEALPSAAATRRPAPDRKAL